MTYVPSNIGGLPRPIADEHQRRLGSRQNSPTPSRQCLPSRAVLADTKAVSTRKKRAGGSGPLDISYEPLAHLQCTGLPSSLLLAQPRGEVEFSMRPLCRRPSTGKIRASARLDVAPEKGTGAEASSFAGGNVLRGESRNPRGVRLGGARRCRNRAARKKGVRPGVL